MTTDRKVLWLPGATGGIGRALIEHLHPNDWTIAASSRDQGRCADLEAAYPHVVGFTMDARNPEQVGMTAAAILDKLGKIDALAHLVGSFMLKGAHQLKDDDWADTIDINLNSAFYTLRAVIPSMQRNKAGSVVLMSSVAAQTGLPSHEAIAAAKGGISSLVRSAAATYATRNIRINAIAPGLTETPLSAPLLANQTSRQISEKMHPLNRVGQPEQVASAIAWLLSDHADWTTGQILALDGGLSTLHQRPKA